jgi:hypothetical protein
MTALIVIGAILLFLLFLLLTPASLEIHYARGAVNLKARYLFFRIDPLKKRSEKKKKEEPAKKEEAGPEKEEKPKKEKNLLKTGWELLKASRRGLSILRKHLVFSRVRVYLRVGGSDAHQTAVSYAKISEAVTAGLDVIALAFVLRKPTVVIAPDFLAGGIDADVTARVGIRPLFVIAAGASVFYRYLRLQHKPRVNRKRIVKVVKKNERAKRAASNQ